MTETSNLNPRYFAFVMATGIISIEVNSLGMSLTGSFLFLINNIAYAVLIILMVTRFSLSPLELIKSITGHEQSSSLFTVVVGTCVVGSQFVAFRRNMPAGCVLWIVGAVLWAVLLYSFFTAMMTKESKRPIEDAWTEDG